MYTLVKTNQENNTAKDSTSCCGRRYLIPKVLKTENRTIDTSEMQSFINYLDNSNNLFTEDCIFATFEKANMFLSTDD